MVKVMAESLSVAAGAAGGASRSIQEAFQQRIAQQSASGDQAPVQAAEQSVTARAIEANGQTPRVDASQQATDASRVSVSQEAIARLASERASGVAEAIAGNAAAPTAQDDAAPPGVVPSQSLRGQIDELLGDRAPGSSVASAAREQSPGSQAVGQSVARVATESSGPSAVARQQAEDVRAENQSNPSSVGGGVEVSGRNRITPQQ